jgi:hypothetical protein
MRCCISELFDRRQTFVLQKRETGRGIGRQQPHPQNEKHRLREIRKNPVRVHRQLGDRPQVGRRTGAVWHLHRGEADAGAMD